MYHTRYEVAGGLQIYLSFSKKTINNINTTNNSINTTNNKPKISPVFISNHSTAGTHVYYIPSGRVHDDLRGPPEASGGALRRQREVGGGGRVIASPEYVPGPGRQGPGGRIVQPA